MPSPPGTSHAACAANQRDHAEDKQTDAAPCASEHDDTLSDAGTPLGVFTPVQLQQLWKGLFGLLASTWRQHERLLPALPHSSRALLRVHAVDNSSSSSNNSSRTIYTDLAHDTVLPYKNDGVRPEEYLDVLYHDDTPAETRSATTTTTTTTTTPIRRTTTTAAAAAAAAAHEHSPHLVKTYAHVKLGVPSASTPPCACCASRASAKSPCTCGCHRIGFGPFLPHEVAVTREACYALRQPLQTLWRSCRVEPSSTVRTWCHATNYSQRAHVSHVRAQSRGRAPYAAPDIMCVNHRIRTSGKQADARAGLTRTHRVHRVCSDDALHEVRGHVHDHARHGGNTPGWPESGMKDEPPHVVHSLADDVWNVSVVVAEAALAGFPLYSHEYCHLAPYWLTLYYTNDNSDNNNNHNNNTDSSTYDYTSSKEAANMRGMLFRDVMDAVAHAHGEHAVVSFIYAALIHLRRALQRDWITMQHKARMSLDSCETTGVRPTHEHGAHETASRCAEADKPPTALDDDIDRYFTITPMETHDTAPAHDSHADDHRNDTEDEETKGNGGPTRGCSGASHDTEEACATVSPRPASPQRLAHEWVVYLYRVYGEGRVHRCITPVLAQGLRWTRAHRWRCLLRHCGGEGNRWAHAAPTRARVGCVVGADVLAHNGNRVARAVVCGRVYAGGGVAQDNLLG